MADTYDKHTALLCCSGLRTRLEKEDKHPKEILDLLTKHNIDGITFLVLNNRSLTFLTDQISPVLKMQLVGSFSSLLSSPLRSLHKCLVLSRLEKQYEAECGCNEHHNKVLDFTKLAEFDCNDIKFLFEHVLTLENQDIDMLLNTLKITSGVDLLALVKLFTNDFSLLDASNFSVRSKILLLALCDEVTYLFNSHYKKVTMKPITLTRKEENKQSVLKELAMNIKKLGETFSSKQLSVWYPHRDKVNSSVLQHLFIDNETSILMKEVHYNQITAPYKVPKLTVLVRVM